jgi:hypothetical protein
MSILKILTSYNFNSFIEYIFILPLMYLIQYDYNKYKYIALFMSVFILIKNIIILNLMDLFKKNNIKNDLIQYSFIFRLIKMFVGIIFFFLQFKYKILINYNIWIANLFYLKYFIKFMSDKYSLNSIKKINN